MKEIVYRYEDISPTYRALSAEEQKQVRIYLASRWTWWGRLKVWLSDLWAKVW